MTRAILVSGWAHEATAMAPLLESLDPQWEKSVIYFENLAQSLESTATDGPVIGIGWSTGAIALLEREIQHPGTFSRMVLISATARFCRTTGYRGGYPERSLEAMIAGLGSDPVTVLRTFLTNAAFPLELEVRNLTDKTDAALRMGMHRLSNGLRYLQETDLRGTLADMKVPTLLIHGENDRIVPCSAGRYLAEHLPQARLETFGHMGHDIPAQANAGIRKSIRDFLATPSA